jgi:hypothetical protein
VKRILFAAAVCVLAPGFAAAGDACAAPVCLPNAASCGNKTCKVVREMKKVTKTVWVVECEEFCPSLPGCACGGHGCGTCGAASCDGASCDPCASLRKPMVPPKCCAVRTRKKLVKKEIECEVPVYKCVVAGCGNGSGCGEDAPDPAKAAPPVAIAPLPPLPLAAPSTAAGPWLPR